MFAFVGLLSTLCISNLMSSIGEASDCSSNMGAKMRGGFLLFFAFGITLAKNENAVSRLIDDLFDDAGYNKDVVPMQKPADETTNVNAINIAVGLSVISMGLNPAGILHASTWLRTSWSDYRLKWNPAHYEGLKSIRIPPNMVWKKI